MNYNDTNLIRLTETLEGTNLALWVIALILGLILIGKDCHGSTYNVAQAIKELTDYLRSRHR